MKLPGKSSYSGRRRDTRQRTGNSSHPESTGGEYKKGKASYFALPANTIKKIQFSFPSNKSGYYVGFGGYFACSENVSVSIHNPNCLKYTLEHYQLPDLSKFGSMWINEKLNQPVIIEFYSTIDTVVHLYDLHCGIIWHEAFQRATDNGQNGYLKNMHSIMPEAGFYIEEGKVEYNFTMIENTKNINPIYLKTCNRCARFLPINIHNERNHLAFSNHCISNAPCIHPGFGFLKDMDYDGNRILKLKFGYQLECRFCKKYYVNMALNEKRSAAQMKEDGQRRRNFELLIAELNNNSKLLSYRVKTGSELTEDIWNKFNRRCFKCHCEIKSSRNMHLDHTRPLALLWPLDQTATALCSSCNTSKRDRPPAEFYTQEQLVELSGLTGLSINELISQEPNHAVIQLLIQKQDWFFDVFLCKAELLKEREGKITSELVVKALDKVLRRSQHVKYEYSFVEEYNRRRDAHIVYSDTEDLSSVI